MKYMVQQKKTQEEVQDVGYSSYSVSDDEDMDTS